MNNTDIIKDIIISYKERDDNKFLNTVNRYIEKEKLKKHNSVVKELEQLLNNKSFVTEKRFKETVPIPRDSEKGFQLLEIKNYDYSLDDLKVEKNIMNQLLQIISEFKYSDVLATYNMSYKNKILLCGPPGTGKTFTAQIISSVLNIPLVYIRFDTIISSYLGETANNLKKVFDFLESDVWIVLFDEFDIIAKNRNDSHEHGEIKRVVNNFLQMMDNFDGDSIIFAATNHQQLLDPAIWRRFDDIIYYDLPNDKIRRELFDKYIKIIKRKDDINMEELVKKSKGLSASDIKMIVTEAIKISVINSKDEIDNNTINLSLNKFLKRNKIRNGKK
ncbi:ATP-binding protein [Brachyspira pilosicoli]|uniref:AAA family ATPase n=1 Tax=Brachyspira pilosicoli TaxID=52584 RepID=UPI001C67265B|nr:ATP-binding protein [Brachyspira pilosicoli]MBW5398453.1 ATP-binding protein [Brachyspira pilosicoli]